MLRALVARGAGQAVRLKDGELFANDPPRVVFLLAGAHCTGSVLELHPEHIPGMLGAGVGAAK